MDYNINNSKKRISLIFTEGYGKDPVPTVSQGVPGCTSEWSKEPGGYTVPTVTHRVLPEGGYRRVDLGGGRVPLHEGRAESSYLLCRVPSSRLPPRVTPTRHTYLSSR